MRNIPARTACPLVLVSLLVLSWNWAAGEAQSESGSAAEEGKRLVEEACVQCHSLRPLNLVRADAEEWRKMVYDMISQGAQVAPDEIPPLISYLSTAFGTQALLGSGPTESKQSEQEWRDQLPRGEGRALVASSCRGCHSLQDVIAFRGDQQAWQAVVGRMIRLGAPIPGPEASMVTQYLARSFGPEREATLRPSDSSPAPEGIDSRGQQLVEEACVQCHSLRPLTLVQADSEEWTRIIYDMISQGAQVAPDEVPVLVRHLAQSSREN